MNGALLFGRYAYPPNELGYCGPADHRSLLEYGAAGVTDPGLAQLARGFSGAWPYLELIAQSTGIGDPLDARVVEAYWVGNALLDRVGMTSFGNSMEDRFKRRIAPSWAHLAEAIPAGAVPHHSFHVFGVYPWFGLLDSGSDRPLEVLDRCRIRWGRVIAVAGDQAVVRSRRLTWSGGRLRLGPPEPETVTRAVDGLGFLSEVAPGDWVSMHWHWLCDRLSERQLAALRHYTTRQLAISTSASRIPVRRRCWPSAPGLPGRPACVARGNKHSQQGSRRVKVEIWSDVVCPWCYIGKRRFEQAMSRFPHRDEVEVRWRSFELDPSAPATRDGDYAGRLAAKYRIDVAEADRMIATMTEAAAREGVEMRFDRARPGNTFTAHRLLHLAADHDLQDELKERLLAACFTEGAAIGDPEALARVAIEVGLDSDAVRGVLSGDSYADGVRADERQAATYGITGVPFFVVDGRYGVSGAQPPEVLLQVLEQAWAERRPTVLVGVPGATAGAGCEGDTCAV